MENLNFDAGSTWEEVASGLTRSAADTERLMLAVYYLFQADGNSVIETSIIQKEYFSRMRWPRPSNLAATANYCASQGWLSPVGVQNGHKHWRITRKGVQYVESLIGGKDAHMN